MDPRMELGPEPAEAVYLLGLSPRTSTKLRSTILDELRIVRCETRGTIDCWFVTVSRDDFEGESAERNLSDIQWLSPRVLAHQHAVELLSKDLPFYPAHFGTLFSSLEQLFLLVETNRRILLSFFAGDARHVEWGVKCFVAWPRAVEAFQESTNSSDPRRFGEGMNYLRRKQMIRHRDQAVRDWLNTTLSELDREAASLAVKSCKRKANLAAEEGDFECVANMALLVERSRHEEVARWVETKNSEASREERILTLQLTGPWPLYSFLPTLESADTRGFKAA